MNSGDPAVSVPNRGSKGDAVLRNEKANFYPRPRRGVGGSL